MTLDRQLCSYRGLIILVSLSSVGADISLQDNILAGR